MIADGVEFENSGQGKPVGMPANSALATYLKDHLAGSKAGVFLARRIAAGADDEAERTEMESVAADIQADRQRLLALMDSLEVSPSRFKEAAAWVGEKLGALKLNASAPDRRLLQYESMIMGVTGKLELWRALSEGGNGEPGLSNEELRTLRRRAEDQRSRLENLHGRAASALRD